MIKTEDFYNELIRHQFDTFYGVPDSLLKDICAYITLKTPPKNHIITANEGNAIALAAGHHIATGKTAVVYLQNSGLGNTINPLLSLADEKVYKIPMILMIGWRGEPGVKDEPQHQKQGEINEELLRVLGIDYVILTENYQEDLESIKKLVEEKSKPVALLIRKSLFSEVKLPEQTSIFSLTREEVLEKIINNIDAESVIVSTTGKTSREIYEIREKNNQDHSHDFLTVGSMGHTSSIALGIALNTEKMVYCIDGDGSMIMHLGSLGVVAQNSPDNLKYIVINNGAHESVGSQPTIAFNISLKKVLKELGFSETYEINEKDELEPTFKKFNKMNKSALVINVKTGSRSELGRPKESPIENKLALMEYLKKDK